jgi:hypothetical protein
MHLFKLGGVFIVLVAIILIAITKFGEVLWHRRRDVAEPATEVHQAQPPHRE